MSAAEARGSHRADISAAVLTTPVLPADTNSYGNIFGGHLVALIDKTASITAFRHARQNVVTASIDRVDFHQPVKLGDILTLTAELVQVGVSSMVVGVKVQSEDRLTGDGHEACTARLTFVAVDAAGRPSPVPKLEPEEDADRPGTAGGPNR